MTACGYPMSFSTGFSTIALIIGSKKAAVFPEPVWAQAIRSLPCLMIGIAVF